jgi:hypothetical protein
MKGNESDCICAKTNGKHTRRCDAYRLNEFMLKTASIITKEIRKEEFIEDSERFLKWMHARVGYEKLPMKTYMDGEPYFSSEGAEMSLREFLRREKELTEEGHPNSREK